MTWYTNTEKTTLDYSKPIMATSGDGMFLLLPTCQDRSYEFRGYDWFNVEKGEWNSCRNYKTAEEAVRVYEKDYKISNYEFKV